jgi:hypothetical protein
MFAEPFQMSHHLPPVPPSLVHLTFG